MESDDMSLVRAYAADQSERVFEQLMTRHLNLVHSAALRRVGDVHLAEEITQVVFIILARKAGTLGPKTILSGWLYRTTRYAAADALKSRRRRQQREQEAHMRSLLTESPADDSWQQIAPLLEAAMDSLYERDRNALLLRFFEGKSLGEVGAALGASENAAKKRVNRALEKLRVFFAKRKLVMTTTIIAGAISAHSVQAASATLPALVTSAAAAKGAVAASASTATLLNGTLKIMAWAKLKTALVISVGILLAAGTTTLAVKEIEGRNDWWQDAGGFNQQILNARPQVTIVRARRIISRGIFEYRGMLLGYGIRAQTVMDTIYENDGARAIVTTPLPKGTFDFIATSRTGAREALAKEAESVLGLVGRRQMITTNVWSMTVRRPGAPGLRPAPIDRRGEDVVHVSDPGFPAPQMGLSSTNLPGHITAKGMKLSLFAARLESHLNIPIIDHTGLTNAYDIELKWNEGRAPDEQAALKQAVLEQLGFELTDEVQPVEFIIVDKAK